MQRTVQRAGKSAPNQSRLRFWRAALLAIFVLALVPRELRAASFTATLDTDTVTVGESATLTLKFEGGQPRSVSAIPAIENLDMADQGSSQAYNIINGQISMSVSDTVVLTPRQPGDYTIPALTAEINGQKLTTQPLKLKAVKGAPPAAGQTSDQLAFFKLVPSKKEVFVGEVFTVEVRVFIRDGVANAGDILGWFDRFPGCPLKAEGFSVLKTAHMQQRQARSGNVVYHVATLVTSLMPVKTGTLSLGPMDLEPIPLKLPTGNRRRDMWDPFGMFEQYEEKRVTLTAEPETVTAMALPKENAPANFTGAVGNYTLAVSAGPTNVAVGDPVTVKIQISGHGALDALALPEQPAWNNFKTYPPTTKVETTGALGLEGTKTFEQVVVPQSPDVTSIPPVSFSYFDSDRKSYRTLSQPAIPIVVRPSSAAPAPTVATTTRAKQDNNAPATQDIVEIKQRMGTLAQAGPLLAQRTWFIALQGVPVLAWLSALVWRRRTDALANNPRLRRQRQVAQLVREKLAELRRLAAEKKSEEFFATLFHLLQEQLGERLDVPASAITEAVIPEHLEPRGVPEAILTPLHEMFQTCNLVRYAPIKSSQELAAIVPKLENLLRDLQQMKA
jgi:hypothetical protein